MSGKTGMGGKREPQPTFDFTRVGRNFGKRWQEILHRATAAGKVLMSLMPEGNSREAIEEFEALHAEYHEKLSAIGDEQAAEISKILKTVPKSWLLTDAPADIDWSDEESLDWIQVDRYTQLLKIVGEGKAYLASSEAKN